MKRVANPLGRATLIERTGQRLLVFETGESTALVVTVWSGATA